MFVDTFVFCNEFFDEKSKDCTGDYKGRYPEK